MNRRPLPLTLAAAAAGLLVLSGCDVSQAGASGSDATDASGTVTVYTSEPEGKMDETIAAFNKEHPDIEVKVFRAGTGELKTRIASEKESGKIGADVLLAADIPTFEGYAAAGDLATLDGVQTDGVDEKQIDDEKHYIGTRIIPTVIAYNTEAVDTPPSAWSQLTDKQYAGKIAMPNPEVSGAAAFNTAVWLNQDGLGRSWLEGLAANEPAVLESNGPVAQNVAAGTQPIGIVVDYPVRDLAAEGSPVAVAYPSDGVPYVNQPAGILSDAQNPEGAAAFISFLVSEAGQRLAVEQNYVPVRSDVGTPEGAPELADLALIEPDYQQIVSEQDAAIETFKELFN